MRHLALFSAVGLLFAAWGQETPKATATSNPTSSSKKSGTERPARKDAGGISVHPGRVITERPARKDAGGTSFRPGGGKVANSPAAPGPGGVTIPHSAFGLRRIVAQRPDHSAVVVLSLGRGYVQRPYAYQGHEFAHRTYYADGVARTSLYSTYAYRGIVLQAYVAVRYYSPSFYGWTYNSWPIPVIYRWDWIDRPWYGYDSGYFTPFPAYPNPSLWLTDYIISTRLAEAYYEKTAEDTSAAEVSSSEDSVRSALGFTPEVKQAIATEVRWQIVIENSERQVAISGSMPDPALNGVPRLLGDSKAHVFVVGQDFDAIDGGGQPCVVATGDAVLVMGGSPVREGAVLVEIAASNGRGCRAGSMVSVDIASLQELENQMRETVDQGLDELYAHAGQKGLPALPPSAAVAPVSAPYANAAPPPDANVAAELGLTTDEVLAALGTPRVIAHLGSKQIYFYEELKVIFVDGRVSSVE
jgi:hypothetical protein